MHEVITAETARRPHLSVRRMCHALDVSRAQYYRRRQLARPVAAIDQARMALRHLAHRYPTYGYRYLTQLLHTGGYEVVPSGCGAGCARTSLWCGRVGAGPGGVSRR